MRVSETWHRRSAIEGRGGAVSTGLLGILVLTVTVGLAVGYLLTASSKNPSTSEISEGLVEGEGLERDGSTQKYFPVIVNRPSGPPRIPTGLHDSMGKPITVDCATCHANRHANHQNRTSGDLKEFHTNIDVVHGNISCLSCHHPDDYQSLRLADGSRIDFEDVMQLCAQCHGPQMREFERGVHGGMNGYWDLSRGPQTKNNCTDCHLPHTPKFPKMRIEFKPQDRFLDHPHSSASGNANGGHHD